MQVITALGSSIAPFMVGAMIVAAPSIGAEFGANVQLLSWLTAGFFLAAAAFLMPFGRVADVRGSRKVFTIGMAVYVLSTLISALAPSMVMVIVGRMVMGVGAAMVFGTSLAILSLVFPEQERGKAIGINVTAMFAGFTVGLLVGGFLAYYVSWRGIFFMAAALAALNLVLIQSKVRTECELARVKDYDPVGMVLFSASTVMVFYGLSQVETFLGLLFLVAGGAGFLAFLLWERRYPHPLVHRDISRSVDFRLASLTNVIYQCGSFSIPFLLSLHLQYVTGFDSRAAGLMLIVPQSVMLLLGPFSGRIMRRFTHRLVAAAGATVNALGLILLLTISLDVPLEVLLVSLVLIGVGTAFFMPAVVSWALGAASRENFGVASSFMETMRLAGMTLSNTVLILVFGVVLGSSPVNPGNLGGFVDATRVTVLAYLGFSFIGVMVAVMAQARRKGISQLPPSE